jgi:hypothetical protein
MITNEQLQTNYEVDWLLSFANDIEEEQKQIRKDHRVEQCGIFHFKQNLYHGGIDSYPLYCRDWRRCSGCRARRLKEQRQLLIIALEQARREGKKMYFVKLDEITPQLKKFLRALTEANYKRCPTLDGTTGLFFVSDSSGEIEITRDILMDDDFLAPYVVTPQHMKISGQLGKAVLVESQPVEDNTPKQIEQVNMPVYTSQADKQEVMEYYRKAIRVTSDKSYDTLQDAVDETVALFESDCRNNNVHFVRDHYEKHNVNLYEVEWVHINAIKTHIYTSSSEIYTSKTRKRYEDIPF